MVSSLNTFWVKRQLLRSQYLHVRYVTANQHRKWVNFYFEHFPQKSKLTLGRARRACCAPGDQDWPVSNFDRLSWALGASLRVMLAAIKSAVNLCHQEWCRHGEHGQGLILSFGESVQNKNWPIFDAECWLVVYDYIFKIHYISIKNCWLNITPTQITQP